MCETVSPAWTPISSKWGKVGGTGLFGGRPELAATGLCCAEATIADRRPKRKSLRIMAGGLTDCIGFSAELGFATLSTPSFRLIALGAACLREYMSFLASR